jgi:hypothetical protein
MSCAKIQSASSSFFFKSMIAFIFSIIVFFC